jgi:hypothetical protein
MIKRILFLISFLVLLVSIALLGYSFYHPGRVDLLDTIRLPIQSRIMASVGDVLVSQYYVPIEATSVSPQALTLPELEQHLDLLQPGDIFFTDSEKYVSSRFIPGKWKHSGIYLGTKQQAAALLGGHTAWDQLLSLHFKTGRERLILDSSAEGVAIRDFSELSNLKSISMLIALSAFRINRPQEDLQVFISHAFDQLGKPYDFDLLLDNPENVYCSELLYHSLKRIAIDLPLRDMVYGREVLTPDIAVRFIMSEGIPAGAFELVLKVEKGSLAAIGSDTIPEFLVRP